MPGHMKYPAEARRHTFGLLLSLNQFISETLNFVFPPRCAGCGRVDTIWCVRCQRELDQIPITLHRRRVFDQVEIVSTGIHADKLQRAVQALKYEHIQELHFPLAERLVSAYHQLGWSADLIVPIPMHLNRLAQRGYNQAELLAGHLALRLALPSIPGAVHRFLDTRSQVGLTREERLLNVRNAFRADPNLLSGRAVLIVDDVCTSGATLTACAQAIMTCGAAQVYGLTVTTA